MSDESPARLRGCSPGGADTLMGHFLMAIPSIERRKTAIAGGRSERGSHEWRGSAAI